MENMISGQTQDSEKGYTFPVLEGQIEKIRELERISSQAKRELEKALQEAIASKRKEEKEMLNHGYKNILRTAGYYDDMIPVQNDEAIISLKVPISLLQDLIDKGYLEKCEGGYKVTEAGKVFSEQ